MKAAGFWRRATAVTLDTLVFLPFTVPLSFFAKGHRDLSIAVDLISFPLFHGYPVVCHYLWGQTLGKMALGVKVVTMEGKRLDLVQSILRSSIDIGFAALMIGVKVMGDLSLSREEFSATGFFDTGKHIADAMPQFTFLFGIAVGLSGFWGLLGIVVMVFHPLKRTLHDLIAGTRVIVLSGAAEAAPALAPDSVSQATLDSILAGATPENPPNA